MEGGTSVKIEPEEDFEYNLHQEEKFEIKFEIDLPIKSEECFKGEVNYYHQTECSSRPITFPPIKEELPSENDLPIKSEEGFKEELNYYQQPECCPGSKTCLPIKEELTVRKTKEFLKMTHAKSKPKHTMTALQSALVARKGILASLLIIKKT
ncbi:unnamed protein product [Timema podura]|uniref:Uncharacterized protein n=1 Tax=Timema podura TaxID=61482 RepID=A0ABN7P046_TIMPD|nr:unnamed protein product [Timema podura]